MLKLNIFDIELLKFTPPNSNTTLVKVKSYTFMLPVKKDVDSNTTLVKVKFYLKFLIFIKIFYSNTTLVKVKLFIFKL